MDITRVVVADNHPLTRLGVRTALGSEPGIEVVGEAEDGIEAVLTVEGLEPDLLILEVCLPEMNGVSAARHVRVNNPDVRILVLTSSQDEDSIAAMLGEGVSGYLLKSDPLDSLAVAVRAVAEERTWFTPQIINTIAQRVAGRSLDPEPPSEFLTTRELEVLQRVAQGYTNKEIAASLTIAERTVRYHVSNIFAKLGVSTRIMAVVEALRQGLAKV